LLATRACIEGAGMNVRINLSGLKDETVKAGLRQKMETVVRESEAQYQDALELVEKKLAG